MSGVSVRIFTEPLPGIAEFTIARVRLCAYDDPMLKFTDVILDCPDPWKLAEFYAEVLGWEINTDTSQEDWVNLRNDGIELSFQRVADYQPPSWPGQDHPQQFHLDFEVDEFEPERRRVTELGATFLKSFVGESGYGWQVYTDPAGHPFCLCRNRPQP